MYVYGGVHFIRELKIYNDNLIFDDFLKKIFDILDNSLQIYIFFMLFSGICLQFSCTTYMYVLYNIVINLFISIFFYYLSYIYY